MGNVKASSPTQPLPVSVDLACLSPLLISRVYRPLRGVKRCYVACTYVHSNPVGPALLCYNILLRSGSFGKGSRAGGGGGSARWCSCQAPPCFLLSSGHRFGGKIDHRNCRLLGSTSVPQKYPGERDLRAICAQQLDQADARRRPAPEGAVDSSQVQAQVRVRQCRDREGIPRNVGWRLGCGCGLVSFVVDKEGALTGGTGNERWDGHTCGTRGREAAVTIGQPPPNLLCYPGFSCLLCPGRLRSSVERFLSRRSQNNTR